MRNIQIERLPNQSLSFSANGSRWELTIKTAVNVMSVDIVVDGETILRGQRAVVGAPLIPYEYLATKGNLAFITEGDRMPWWEEFGVTQSLMYVTPAELEANGFEY